LYPDAELRTVGPGVMCFECGSNAGAIPASKFPLSGIGIAAVAAALIPFFGHYTTSSSISENGEVVSATYRDYVALAGGALAIVLGGVAVLGALKATEQRNLRLGIVGGAIALGVLQVLRGLGVV
jgi:hypothetical protein